MLFLGEILWILILHTLTCFYSQIGGNLQEARLGIQESREHETHGPRLFGFRAEYNSLLNDVRRDLQQESLRDSLRSVDATLAALILRVGNKTSDRRWDAPGKSHVHPLPSLSKARPVSPK